MDRRGEEPWLHRPRLLPLHSRVACVPSWGLDRLRSRVRESADSKLPVNSRFNSSTAVHQVVRKDVGDATLASLAGWGRGKRRAALLDQKISLSLHLRVVRVFSGPSLEPPIALRGFP